MPRKLSRRVGQVWARLGQWYGSRLAENYGPTPPEDWAALIERTDDERLEQALLTVRRDSPIHPPTLGQIESAIPARRFGPDAGRSAADVLCDAASRAPGLCRHQLAKPWNYFGPVVEMVSKHRGDELVSQPQIRGVQIPACEECEKPTHRLLLEEIQTSAAA